MIKRILVGLAGTTYTPVAIQYAVELAQSQQAELTGVTVLDSRVVRLEGGGLPKAPGFELVRSQRIEIARAQIDLAISSFRAACEAAGVGHRVAEETGDAFTRLVDLARYHDLMVFGLRSVFDYDFRGGDPEALLVRLLGSGVRPMIAVPETFRPVHRVLIAYSGSIESAGAMKRFVGSRLWPSAPLRVITFQPDAEEADRLLGAAEEYCRAHGRHVEHQSNPGQAGDLLLGAAALWQADLVVMGNSARSMFSRKVLGDTLLATLRGTSLPLFLAQ